MAYYFGPSFPSCISLALTRIAICILCYPVTKQCLIKVTTTRTKLHVCTSPKMVDYLRKVRKVPDHECMLPVDEDDDLVISFIYTGLFVSFRRKFHRFIMVDDTNPQSKILLKSTAEIRKEQERHLKHNFHTIHPFSKYRTFWEALMSCMYFSHFLVMPVEMFEPHAPDWVVWTKFVGDLVCLTDIGVHFFSGYHDHVKGEIVLSLRQIAKTYLLGWFVLDFIGSLPINMYLTVFHLQDDFFYLKLTYIFKLLRLLTFFVYVERLCARFGVTIQNVKAIKMTYATVILVLWGTSLKYLAVTVMERYVTPESDSFVSHISFMDSLLFTILHTYRALFLIGFEHRTSMPIFTHIMDISYIFLGAIVNMMIFAIITHVYMRTKCNSNKYQQIVQQITNYMKYKAIPPILRAKIIRYIDFKCHKAVLNEDEILATLSTALNQDLLFHKCKHMVERVDFFRGLAPDIMLKILSKLKSEIYLTGEVIIRAGIVGNAMYFVYLGTVAVYASDGTEKAHLTEGSYFGETALMVYEPRTITVIAVKECELFKLSRKEFNEAMDGYPAQKKKMRDMALAADDPSMARTEDSIM